MKKRVLSLLLVLALCVGMVPAPVWAEETPAQLGQEEHQEDHQTPEGGNQEEHQTPEGENQEEPQEPEGGTQEEPQEPEEGNREVPQAPGEDNQELPQEPVVGNAPEPVSEEPEEEEPQAEEEKEPPEEEQEEPEEAEDEEVKLVQALLDALPSPEEMTEEHIDALEIAFDAYQSLTEEQQGKITGADRFETLFAWVNGQVAMLADNEPGWTESGNTVILTDYNGSKQLSLTQDTVLELNGTSKMEREYPILLNGHTLTVRGSGSLEAVMQSENIYAYYYGAISNGTTYGDHKNGTLILESGTLIARGPCSGVAVGSVIVKGGSLYTYSEYSNGIETFNLRVEGETTYVYASGSEKNKYAGIAVDHKKAAISDGLSILYSGKKDAAETDMEFGTAEGVFENSDARTVLICKSDKPLISVGAQTGALYENAGGKATFTISGRNYTLVEAQWVESAPAGLTATVAGDTLTVTGDKTVRAGTYSLTLTAIGEHGTAAKNVSVTVSGVPLTIAKQPEDNVTGQVEQTDFRSAFVEVTPSRNDNVTYQWKVKGENEQDGGTDLAGQTGARLYLADIPENMRQDTAESWKKTARVYCTVTYDHIYSVDSETVTVIFSTCDHAGQYSTKGECQRCGYKLDVNAYDWIYKGNKYKGMVTPVVGEGGTVYLLHDLKTVEGFTFPENVTVDLQDHTVGSFSVTSFQNTTITNGTITNLNFPDSDKNVGPVTLAGITVTGEAKIGVGTTVTVRADCVFKGKADIQGETKLTGGTFEKGIAYSDGNAQHLLDILADGYAYFKKDDQGNDQICKYFRADSENVSVKPHTCTFSFAECVCGRVCKHTHRDENGVCTVCGLMAKPFAVEGTSYATLAEAVNAATDGATITMGSDARLERESLTGDQLTVSKNITLDLGGHTLVEECEETNQKAPISVAGTVTIRNGTIENRYTSKPTKAVDVVQGGNLTVENADLKGSVYAAGSDQEIVSTAVSVYGGSMTLVSGTVRGLLVGTNGESEEDPTFARGSLTVTGGTITRLSVEYGTVQLYGGTIYQVEKAAEALLKDLLAPYHAYADSNNNPLAPDQVPAWLNKQPVIIIPCTHPAGISETQACQYCGRTCNHPKYENGACTICGTVCKHPGDQVDENGLCACGLQMAVKVQCGERVSYYARVKNSDGKESANWDIATGLEDGVIVTLLVDDLLLKGTVNGKTANTVTLNLNGKNVQEYNTGIYLSSSPTVKLIGTGSFSGDSSTETFRVLSGTLDLSQWKGGNLGKVYINGGKVVPPQNGGITRLELNGEGTQLDGGWYGTVIHSTGAGSDYVEVGRYLTGGHAFRNDDGTYVAYTQKINNKVGLENVTVVLCPHEFTAFPTDLDERKCPYCNTILAALVETTAGVKGYASAQLAVDGANQGDTVVLLNDLAYSAGTLTVSKPCTLDLNGHTVETLTVTGDVTLESLLPEGYAYKTGSRWVSEPSGKTLTDVTMALVPFKDLRAENDNVAITYGQTATLKALVTGYGTAPTMQWSQKTNGTYTQIPGETGDTLTLSGLPAGSYVYRFTYNVEGYYKSVDFRVTVEKATVQVTTAPTAVLNLVYTGENQTLITPGAADNGTMFYTIGPHGSYNPKIPVAKNAGTYEVYYYVSPTDQDNYLSSEPQYVQVTIAPRSMEDVTVTLTGDTLTYDGTNKTQKIKVTLGDVDVTSQIHVLGNTATKAGSYTMRLLASGNFTGSKELTWSIAPKSVTAQVTVGDKDFDGTREAAVESATLTGVLAGDAVAVQAGKVSFAHAAPGTWEVTLEKLTLTGADAGNYSLANPQPTGLTARIRANDRYLDLSQTFPEETEVIIDGKKQTVSNDGGSFVDLRQEGGILTTYETNGSYPTEMRVYRILREKDGARLEEIPEFQNLLQYAGCSIRLTGTKGIRMITALDGATKAALTGAGLAGFTLEEYGTVVARKSSLGDNDLTLETGKHNYAYKKGVSDPVFGNAGAVTQYTNVLVGFSLEDCKEELVMRPYILLRDENGDMQTVYGGTVTRSIGYIAKQNENTYRPGTDGYSYIHEIIAAVYGQG